MIVRYFAALRDQCGCSTESIETNANSARELVEQLILKHRVALPSPSIRLAINGEFVNDDAELNEGDEVLLMPPVAGG